MSSDNVDRTPEDASSSSVPAKRPATGRNGASGASGRAGGSSTGGARRDGRASVRRDGGASRNDGNASRAEGSSSRQYRASGPRDRGTGRREDRGDEVLRHGPPVPEEIVASDLDRAARGRLRTLSKENADLVARHLVMAGRLLDVDPERAYEHAQAAVRRAGRVDVVREAAGLCAYATGRYAEALRELRTFRRLNGSQEHIAVMADCERGLGRPERALALADEVDGVALDPEVRAELAIVLSGARLDLGQPDAAVAVLAPVLGSLGGSALADARARVGSAYADALEAAGREEEAARVRSAHPAVSHGSGSPVADEEIVLIDLEDEAPGDVEGGGAP